MRRELELGLIEVLVEKCGTSIAKAAWKNLRKDLEEEKLNSTPSAEQQIKVQICPKCKGVGAVPFLYFLSTFCCNCNGTGKL